MFGKHADPSFLPTVGARGVVYNKENRHILDPRVRERVFIGYDSDKPTHGIFVRETGQVTSTSNVAFIEVPLAAISAATSAGGRHDSNVIAYGETYLVLPLRYTRSPHHLQPQQTLGVDRLLL